jgi:outer membrane receptor protein involved in Fe transport
MSYVKSAVALAISAAFSSTLLSQSAFAEQSDNTSDIEVILVESDFRAMNLQKVASSLSVLTEDKITQRNAQNFEELLAVTPNVNFASGSQRARYFQIRGIGERSQFIQPINPSVGVIIDDVDFTGAGSISSMFDVAQTEVYRGPQGTRYGANALAGLINITTNAPTDNFEGALKLTAGNYNSKGAGVVLSGPANDIANYRLAVEQYKSDGFINNIHLDRDDTNKRDELSVRGKLAIKATDDLNIDVSILHFNFDNGYDAFSLDNNRNTYSDEPGFDQQETTAISSKFTYEGLASATLVSIVSMADSNLAYGFDEDWSFGQYRDQYLECLTATGCLAESGGYSTIDHYFRDKKNATAEFRLVSKPGHEILNNTTSWVVGTYYKQEKTQLNRNFFDWAGTYALANFTSAYETKNIAAFAQLDTQLTDTLLLTSGLRVEQRKADYFDSQDITFDPDETMLGGKLVLAYQMNDDTLIYGSVNRGYKTGGANIDGSLAAELREYDAEFLWNYELGYKTNFLDNAAYLRAAVFYMDRDDIQASTYTQIGQSFVTYSDNAAGGKNYGIEFDGGWQVTDNVEIYGALGLLETKFDNFINGEGDDLSGRDQAHAPNYQFNLGTNWYITESLVFNISVDGKDSFYFSDTHASKSEAVELLNTSLSYSDNDWEIKLWARNLTNRQYANRGFFFGNDPRDGFTDKTYTQLSEPKVVGVTFDYKF